MAGWEATPTPAAVVVTGNGRETVTTGSGNDQIKTGAGNDTINGGGGNNAVSTKDNASLRRETWAIVSIFSWMARPAS